MEEGSRITKYRRFVVEPRDKAMNRVLSLRVKIDQVCLGLRLLIGR